MNGRNRAGAIALGTALGAALLLGACIPCRADLTVQSEISVSTSGSFSSRAGSQGGANTPISVTTYFKGDKARVEAYGAAVTIYDRSKDRVYVLDSLSKTYTVYPTNKFVDLVDQSRAFGGQAPPFPDPLVDLELTPDRTLPVKSIVGQNASRYTFSGLVSLRPTAYTGGGGLGGGGGYGRRRGGGGGGRGSNSAFTERVDGEIWVSDTVSLPTKAKDPMLPLLLQALPANACRKSMLDKLASIKGFPMSTKLNFVIGEARSVEAGGGGGDSSQPTATVSTQVMSLSPAAIDDSLFAVPSDYKEIAAR